FAGPTETVTAARPRREGVYGEGRPPYDSRGDDFDGDREGDVGMEVSGHRVLTDRLDRVDVEVLAVECDAGLLGDGGDDVGGRHRPEQAPFRARLGGDR